MSSGNKKLQENFNLTEPTVLMGEVTMNFCSDLPAGDKPPELLNMVVEVTSGSRDKYEYNPQWEAFVLDRIIPSSVVFPVEYGFVPRTWFDDNDPMDIMVLSYAHLNVGCVVKVRVIGALILEDEKGYDAKILSVLVNDMRFEGIKDIGDVHKHQLTEIQEFFETYKRLEPHKWAKTREWKNSKEALEIVTYAMEMYRELGGKIPQKHSR
jgi:inorganic pyrophosphatase